MAPSSGLLIAFEGIDGSGKSTQARLFVEWAKAQGFDVVASREPTDGPWGRKIREARFATRMSPHDELHAFLEDRREHVRTLISPALQRGATVVLDRYYFSTVAYQGARGMPPQELLRQNLAFAPKPDVVVLVDAAPQLCLERVAARGLGQDAFENLEALTQVREIFLSLVDEGVAVINGGQTPEAVFQNIHQELERRGVVARMRKASL